MNNVIKILGAGMIAVLIFAPLTYAQFGGSAVDIVGDEIILPTQDQNTPDIDTQSQTIAQSLTTTVNGTYAPNTGTISSLDSTLFAGVNPANAGYLMPVTTPLPCNSYDPMVGSIAPALAKTYLNAISIAQQQDTELKGEDFSNIAAN